jgi:hypothetical protein
MFGKERSKGTADSFSFSSLHYDKAVIARMAGVDKTSTPASNEVVKLAARFVLVRFHASPGIIILKLCCVPVCMYWSPTGHFWRFIQRSGLPFVSVHSHVSFCATLSPGGYSWCEAGFITALANGTHTGHQRLLLKGALQLTG